MESSVATLGDFTFWLRLSLSLFAERKLKLSAKVCTYTTVQLNFVSTDSDQND